MIRPFPVLSLLSLLILGCGDATGPEDALLGTWSLQSVDGQPLPADLGDDGEVTAEVYTLRGGGLFSMTTTFRVTGGNGASSETIPDNGTYVLDGSTVTFRYTSDGSTDLATVDHTTLSLEDIGHTFVYRKD